MKKKTNAILNIICIALLLGIFTIMSLLKEDKKFSESENRLLEQKPKFSMESLLSGDYTKKYEEYVTDQFVMREEFIALKTYTDISIGKKDIKGVYLGKDGYLLEKHLPDFVDEKTEEEKLTLLRELQVYCQDREGKGSFHVILAPMADEILKEKLPDFAPTYNQADFLKEVEETVGKDAYIDIRSALNMHKEEEIYYRTDHHWTTLGAYYAYRTWAESMGILPLEKEQFQVVTLTDSFLGSMHSKINIHVRPDSIEKYEPIEPIEYKVYYDLSKTAKDTLYEEKHLKTKNKYGVFLDENHGIIEIDTSVKNGKTLFVIKDSYANCFVPFLTSHYEKIVMLDLRYYRGNLFERIEKDMDVLVLYNVSHFLEEFQYF